MFWGIWGLFFLLWNIFFHYLILKFWVCNFYLFLRKLPLPPSWKKCYNSQNLICLWEPPFFITLTLWHSSGAGSIPDSTRAGLSRLAYATVHLIGWREWFRGSGSHDPVRTKETQLWLVLEASGLGSRASADSRAAVARAQIKVMPYI